MAARSTGIFPREGFNLDAETQVPENVGGSVSLLGDLSKAKTLRFVFIGAVITGDASITLNLLTSDTARYTFTADDVDPNGVIIAHVRGAIMDGGTQDVAYQLVQGTGSATLSGGCFVELVDGPRR